MFRRLFTNVSRIAMATGARRVFTAPNMVRASKATGVTMALFGFGSSCPYHISTDASKPEYVKTVRDSEGAIRTMIKEVMDGGDYDGHGSYGPSFVRLAWHASGTYCQSTKTGGSNGGTMRFNPEAGYGANNGLNLARDRLEAVKRAFPFISYADLYTLAGVVAVEEMGGPVVAWRPGRSDFAETKYYKVPDGRLPDASQGDGHVRDIFYRMGFNDREIVALIGAHAVGKCHPQNSGYDGPWTRSPTTFANTFFTMLLNEKWTLTKKNANGSMQYENEAKDLMMLPADFSILLDPKFRAVAMEYANDEELFFKDFAAAFSKLLELGVPFKQ